MNPNFPDGLLVFGSGRPRGALRDRSEPAGFAGGSEWPSACATTSATRRVRRAYRHIGQQVIGHLIRCLSDSDGSFWVFCLKGGDQACQDLLVKEGAFHGT
jgi:hypothetical protein